MLASGQKAFPNLFSISSGKEDLSLGLTASTKVTKLLPLPRALGRVAGISGRRPTFEHKLSSPHDPGGVHAPAVAALGVDGERGMLADRVRVVVVMPFPGVVVVVEDEVAREEEHLGPHLTALAHPLAMQADGQVSLGGQEGRVVLIRPVDDSTGDAGMVVVLQPRDKHTERPDLQECSVHVLPATAITQWGWVKPLSTMTCVTWVPKKHQAQTVCMCVHGRVCILTSAQVFG